MKEKLSYIKVISCFKDKMSMKVFELTPHTFVFWVKICFNRHHIEWGNGFWNTSKNLCGTTFFQSLWCLLVSCVLSFFPYLECKSISAMTFDDFCFIFAKLFLFIVGFKRMKIHSDKWLHLSNHIWSLIGNGLFSHFKKCDSFRINSIWGEYTLIF